MTTGFLQYGDCIPDGTYGWLSGFDRVLNFKSDSGDLLSLVTEEMGSGPGHMLFSSDGFAQIIDLEPSLVTVDNGQLRLSGKDTSVEFNFSEAQAGCYFSLVDSVLSVSSALGRPLYYHVIRSLLCETAAERSMAFLLDSSLRSRFSGRFEMLFVEAAEASAVEIRKGNRTEGMRKLRGLGFGLTPSGDDFNAGFMVGVGLREGAAARRALLEFAVGGNDFVNGLLSFAAEGRLNEVQARFVRAFVAEDGTTAATVAAEAVLNYGETSGADWLTGFLLALE